MAAFIPPDIEQLATAVAQKIAELPTVNRFVLNRDDAKNYVGRYTDDSFDAWRKRWSVPACSHGRYARRALDRGLEKEARA